MSTESLTLSFKHQLMLLIYIKSCTKNLDEIVNIKIHIFKWLHLNVPILNNLYK